MVHGGQLQGAWHKRRRRLGDSVPGCLLFIAIVIGGSIWGYFKFVHWRPLTRAGHNHTTFDYKKNIPAYLEYGRRMRTGFSFQITAMCDQNRTIINNYKKGEYKGHSDTFESDCTTLCNALLDSIQQFDGQQVPNVLDKAHSKIANCHRLVFESIQALREADAAEGADHQRLIKEAEKKAKEAYTQGMAGVREYNAVWTRTST
ncbi:hypothetical protein JST97_16790 [bacterium]|nr:hypothetical protein [bacterium]